MRIRVLETPHRSRKHSDSGWVGGAGPWAQGLAKQLPLISVQVVGFRFGAVQLKQVEDAQTDLKLPGIAPHRLDLISSASSMLYKPRNWGRNAQGSAAAAAAAAATTSLCPAGAGPGGAS